MSRKLITFLIIVIFCIEAAGVDCLFPTAHTYKNTLRPMAAAVSRDIGTSSILQKASSAGDSTKDHGCPARSFDLISKEFQIRNRMYITSDDAGRKRKAERLKYVIEKTREIPDFLIERFKDKNIISIVVLGTYLWFEKASDIELLIITEGEDELEILDRDFIPIKELLKDKKVAITGIECIAATVGYDSLKELYSWEVFSYAIRGWREGITIFGIDPYKTKELSSCTEKIQHLDFLLDSSEISLKELEDLIPESRYEERAARVVPLYMDRVEERTTEAISVLKEIAARYGKEEIIRPLESIEREYKRRELRQLKKYCQQVHKIYERFMKELKVKPRPSGRKEPRAKGEELSRPEKLNLILEEHTELDTPEELLAYIKKNDPHLLNGISREKQLEFLRDFMFLRYETIPLSKKVLEELVALGKHCGKRIERIEEARNIKPEDILACISEKVKQGIARSEEDIDDSTYSDIKRTKGVPVPHHLFDIARELMVDPIRIIDGRDWDVASAGLPDNEKMKLCRRRKGWTQEECALAFELAGLDFGTRKSIATKRAWVSECERGKRLPDAEEACVIQRVFCDKTLFEEVTEEVEVEVEAPEAAAPKAAVTPRAGILEEIEAKKAEAAVPPKAAKRKVRRPFPGAPMTKLHLYFVDHPEVAGKTPSEIERDHGIPAVSTRTFCRKNKGAAEHFGIEYPAKRKIPQKKREVLAAEPGPPAEEELAAPPEAAEPEEPKVTAEEAAEKAAEEAAKEAKPVKKAKAAKKKAKKEAIIKERVEQVQKIRLKAMAEDPEVDLAMFEADEIFEFLRSPEDRDLVDALDIEGAISELRYASDKLQNKIRVWMKLKKNNEKSKMQKTMRNQWLEAKRLLRRLQALVSTELCDWAEWEKPEIKQRSTEITQEKVLDLQKVEDIRDWVKDNVKLVPEYEGCWNAEASETLASLQGTYFNRANIIVAMLRSVGIPTRYRIITVKKEAVKDLVGPKIYAGLDETIEYVVPMALIRIEEFEEGAKDEASEEYKWITLESVDAENIIESYVVDNIDEYAAEKAKEQKRKAKSRKKDQRGGRGRANPSGQLKALKAIRQAM